MTSTTPANPRPLAVVTGASTGIGRELACELARRGHDLVLCADEDMTDAAAQIEKIGATATAVEADLATREGVERLYSIIRSEERPVSVLCLNAGVGLGGEFARDQRLDDALRLVELNVVSAVHLSKCVLPEMVRRGGGKVLFTSSIAAMMPGPFHALYNASKSFLQSFAQGIAEELSGTGVTVTAVLPGVTDTRFFERAGITDTRMGAMSHKDDPGEVARHSIDALMAGKTQEVVGSTAVQVQAASLRLLPDKVKAKLHRQLTKPGSGR